MNKRANRPDTRQLAERRRTVRYTLSYPDSLPITHARPAILEALRAHRVIVVCGDTGSGKTTQLPKLCLEAGRGVLGMIGHTQPRRIAAHAAAARLAEELGVQVGGAVGVTVRFTDLTDPTALVKVMTDGILLNEIRRDRLLRAYDTLIIDEAHERSLNIDCILGYLKSIERQRPDLKVIITSATIDPERFSRHFGDAPILRVAGRSFPVEIRYRPIPAEQELADGIAAAAQELAAERVGAVRDMLVFLPGERWIRDTQLALARNGPKGYEILPLYARLPASGQQRIFRPGRAPRIVLATNVAETSLTVPRIRYVIDSGLARVARYSPRHRVQGLGVEPIAQANAIQRSGRCGRIAPGVCVRLYAEQEFVERPEFMEPEIQRTGLAGVILRLAAWRLGAIDEFPFVDPPPAKAVNDAYQLLHMLGAMDTERRLTRDGELMARLPVDPRVARLLVVAERSGVLREALVIAAALSSVDPREYPPEHLDAARREHDKLADPRSDFASYLNLWQAYRRERRAGTKALRAWCKAQFLSLRRLKEWHDVHGQLHELVLGLGWRSGAETTDYKAIHRAVLAAFIDFIAEHIEGTSYRGMRDVSAALFPGTPLARKRPRWIVAAERIATERQYLRTVAQVNPRWVVQIAPHLIKRHYLEPAWDAQRGQVMAREVVTLHGLTLTSERRVDYGPIDAVEARRLFLRDGLAPDRLELRTRDERVEFIEHNRRLRDAMIETEARLRRRDLFVGEPGIAAFYDARLPPEVRDRASLLRWCAEAANRALLVMRPEDIASREAIELTPERYPEHLVIANQRLVLSYRLEPGAEQDGITLTLPQALLGVVRAEPLNWLVPGWLPEKVVALLKTLPKDLRRVLVPLPDTCAALLPRLESRRGRQSLLEALRETLAETRGVRVPTGAFAESELPAHLTMRIVVVAADGRELASGRDLRVLQQRLSRGGDVSTAAPRGASFGTKTGVTQWDFGDLQETVIVAQRPHDLQMCPTLIEEHGRVDLRLLPPGPAARAHHRRGVRRLLLKQLPQQVSLIREQTLADRALVLTFHGVGRSEELVDDLLCASADLAFDLEPPIRERAAFEQCLQAGRAELVPAADRLRPLLREVLSSYRQLRAELDGPGNIEIRADLRAQLELLIAPYFLSRTPPEWRVHLPRYLKAARQRWQKAGHRRAKDAELQAEIDAATIRLDRWLAGQPADWPWPAPIVRYRWLLEELRVSLFAQALGTAVPVSVKRLETEWQRALAEAGADEPGQSGRAAS